MLEKMGWSKGKGLGVNEDGQQNFIRVSHKTDQKGMGYQDRDDQWTGHENDFNSLLKSLDNSRNASEEESEPVEEARVGFGFDSGNQTNVSKSIKSKLSGKSLEEMSKKSSVRVHYRKFTRGKDISRYSEKDLANIFGKKIVNTDETVSSSETHKSIDEVPESSYGITTIDTGTTIHDYFTKKKRNKEITSESEEFVAKKKRRKKDKMPKSESIPISNTQFIDDILKILANNKHSGHFSTALKPSNADGNDVETATTPKTSHTIAMDEVFEINRYHAEMFRFVDLDGFPNANLSDLSGYGFTKEFELKISEKSKDQNKINDLWDHALVNKYGKDVIQAKKTKRYSMKHLKKKNLFMKL